MCAVIVCDYSFMKSNTETMSNHETLKLNCEPSQLRLIPGFYFACYVCARYPDSQQFNAVCSALVRRYPALQDRVVFRDTSCAAKHVSLIIFIFLSRHDLNRDFPGNANPAHC